MSRPLSTSLDAVGPGVIVPVSTPAVATIGATTAQTAGALAAGVVLGLGLNLVREYATLYNNTDVDMLIKLSNDAVTPPTITTADFQDKIPPGAALYMQKGETQAVWATAPGATTGQSLGTEESR